MTLRMLTQILRTAVVQSSVDGIPRMGAALAFYATLSFAPLAIILISLVATVSGQTVAEGRIADEMQSAVGREASHALQTMISAAKLKSSGSIRSLVGWTALVVAALGFFFELQDALNKIWKADRIPNRGWWVVVRTRMLSFVVVAVSALLLVATLIISTTISAITTLQVGFDPTFVTHLMQPVLSGLVTVVLFATIFWLLPDEDIAWNEVWFGAVVTTLLFVIGKAAIAVYLSSTAVTSFYGAASSFAILMLWNYYTAQIFLFGAELTKASSIHQRPQTTPT